MRSSDQVCQVPSFCLTFRHFSLLNISKLTSFGRDVSTVQYYGTLYKSHTTLQRPNAVDLIRPLITSSLTVNLNTVVTYEP